jgi:hypothetical protein
MMVKVMVDTFANIMDSHRSANEAVSLYNMKIMSSSRSSSTQSTCLSKDVSTSSSSSQKYSSYHSTVINAPIGVVWESLIDVHDWEWNQCIRLEAAFAIEGKSGRASFYRKGKRLQKRFSFNMVERRQFTLSWSTKFGFCSCTNTIRLEPLGGKRTVVGHTQSFQGIHLGFGLLGHPFKKFKRNVCIMNEGLKNHVESQYFRSLLSNFSSRDMILEGGKSSMTMKASPIETAFWQTPKHLRKELVKCFVDNEVEHPVLFI